MVKIAYRRSIRGGFLGDGHAVACTNQRANGTRNAVFGVIEFFACCPHRSGVVHIAVAAAVGEIDINNERVARVGLAGGIDF